MPAQRPGDRHSCEKIGEIIHCDWQETRLDMGCCQRPVNQTLVHPKAAVSPGAPLAPSSPPGDGGPDPGQV